ncbi:MAG: hypothetical protein PSV13_17725 [Lacunisphaera sp.]|nr:hypothetical protein [Lacunisphaera sp.]
MIAARLAPGPTGPRWLQAGLTVALLGWLPLLWSVLCTAASPGVPWNAARLAPSFALAYGLPVYALRDSGAQLGWFYGPAFPLWNLPATLTSNPTLAVWIAGGWNVLTWLVPVALVLRAAGVVRGVRVAAAAVFAGVLLLGNSVTNYGFYFIHVDGLCLAAGLAAVLGVHQAGQTGRARWLHLAAAGLVVAVWTKQIAVGLAPAMFWHLWREGRWSLAWPLFFRGVVYAAGTTVAVFHWFGAPEVLHNLWLVHSRNPWRGGLDLLGSELFRLFRSSVVWWPLAGFTLWVWRGPGRRPLPPAAGGLVRLLIRVAWWQLPLGLIALLKAGGGLNSLHPVHYLMLALLIAAYHAADHPLAPAAARVAAALWLAAVLVPLGNATRFALGPGSYWRITHRQEELVAQARAQPGRYYYPWNPLVTLIAERKIQPLDDALYCLWLAGLDPSAEKIRAAVPARPIIVYEEPAQSHFALRYFPATKPAP